MSEVVPPLQKNYIANLVKKGKRIDSRKLDEYREIKITPSFIGNAEGSALVELGGTKVLVGIKLEIGEPFKDTPDKGVLITNAELVPLASPEFEPGPPDENAIELARVVDRGIRESEALNLEKMVIKEGEYVWLTFIDIHILDHDGNLFDASTIGAVTALLTAKKPKAYMENGEVKIVDEWEPLPMEWIPASVTIGRINEKLMVDPNFEEENVLDAKICIVFDDGNKICAIQKVFGVLSIEQMKEAVKLSEKKSSEVRQVIMEAVKGEVEKHEKRKGKKQKNR